MKSVMITLVGFFFFNFAHAEVVEGIVAVVNNEIVTYSDLKSFAKKVDKAGMLDERLLLLANQDTLKKDKKEQLNFLINERLLDHEVKKQNLTVTMERVEQQVAEIASNNNMSKQDLYATIKNQGMSISEYQQFIKNSIERQTLFSNEVAPRVRVSDEEIFAVFLKRHPEVKTTSTEFTIAHIYFNPKKGGPEAALARAQSVREKVSNQNFDSIAEQFSEDPNFSSGGLLGTFKAGEFIKELESTVASMAAGDTSDVVKSKSGFHILKVLKRTATEDPRFEKEKEKIRSELFETNFKVQFREWMATKKDEAYIRINNL